MLHYFERNCSAIIMCGHVILCRLYILYLCSIYVNMLRFLCGWKHGGHHSYLTKCPPQGLAPLHLGFTMHLLKVYFMLRPPPIHGSVSPIDS